MAQRSTVNQNVTQEDEEEIIDAMLCADPDCKFNLRDHEKRIRALEVSFADNGRLLESVVKIIESNDETQKATVKAMNELTVVVARIDGKVDNLGQYDTERKAEIVEIKNGFRDFKKEFWKNEDEMKIDPRKMLKVALESWIVKILIGLLSAAGAWGLLSQFINSLPK